MLEEMINDSMEGLDDDEEELEAAAEAQIDAILQSQLGEVDAAMSQIPKQKAKTETEAEVDEAGPEVDLDDMKSRLQQLKS